MNKKAQGLSMNVIIIAVLSILVLVLLVYIITDGFTKWHKNMTCEGLGRTCADSCANLEDGSYAVDSGNSGKAGGCAENEVCCVKVG